MNVYFTETEPQSEEFFERHLPNQQIAFCHDLTQVPTDAECISIFIGSRVTADVVKAHPALRFVATRSTGVDHIDLDCCRDRGITVSYVPNYGENTVAEHTFALLL